MKNKKIRTNKIKCLKCGDIIESTMLVKRCFFSAFGDGIMQMIRVEVVRELIFLYSMLACYNPTGYA